MSVEGGKGGGDVEGEEEGGRKLAGRGSGEGGWGVGKGKEG